MVWFLKLVVSRSLHHTRFASVVDITLILISAGMLAFYFAIAIIDRPSRRVDKKHTELVITDAVDYDAYGCLCSVKTIGYGDFIDYPGYDDDYAFCVGDPPYTNPATSFRGRFGLTASSVCDTATYKLQALLKPEFDEFGDPVLETGRGTWRFSRDNLVTNNTLRNDVKGQIGLFVFDIWNLLSDSLKFTEVLLDRVIRDGAISGNATTMHATANKTYVEVALPIEARLNLLTDRMFNSLQINYNEYLRRCDPRGCYITERVGPETVLLSAAAIVGGNLALFTAIGNAIVKYAEDRYLNQLFQKYLTGQITEQEKEFLRANSPAMATLVDEDGKGIPPGTTLADLNRLKSSGLKSPHSHQVNVGPQGGGGPVPI